MSAVVRIPLNFSDTPTTARYKYCSSFLLLDSRASCYMVHKEKLALVYMVYVLTLMSFSGLFLRYPSDADKHLLARQTGLSRNQVSHTTPPPPSLRIHLFYLFFSKTVNIPDEKERGKESLSG